MPFFFVLQIFQIERFLSSTFKVSFAKSLASIFVTPSLLEVQEIISAISAGSFLAGTRKESSVKGAPYQTPSFVRLLSQEVMLPLR